LKNNKNLVILDKFLKIVCVCWVLGMKKLPCVGVLVLYNKV